MTIKVLSDSALRRKAIRQGYRLSKSRDRMEHWNNHGGYMICDDRNCVVAGVNYDMTDEDVSEFLANTTGS